MDLNRHKESHRLNRPKHRHLCIHLQNHRFHHCPYHQDCPQDIHHNHQEIRRRLCLIDHQSLDRHQHHHKHRLSPHRCLHQEGMGLNHHRENLHLSLLSCHLRSIHLQNRRSRPHPYHQDCPQGKNRNRPVCHLRRHLRYRYDQGRHQHHHKHRRSLNRCQGQKDKDQSHHRDHHCLYLRSYRSQCIYPQSRKHHHRQCHPDYFQDIHHTHLAHRLRLSRQHH